MINTICFTKDKIIIAKGIYSRKNVKIKKQIHIEYPENTYLNGEVLDSVKLSHVITAEMKKEKMKTQSVIFAIQHPEINVVDINVPYVKGRISQAVNVKLSERFIGITDGNYITYKITKVEGNICSGTAFITPKRVLDGYYELSVKLGCKLQAIDYMGNVLYKSMLIEDKENAKKTFLIADMTSEQIVVHLYEEGRLAISRSENSANVLLGEQPVDHDFVFEQKLSITSEDINAISEFHKAIKNGVDELVSFHTTLLVFLKRYAVEHNASEIEGTLQLIHDELKELLNDLALSINFVDHDERFYYDFYRNVMIRFQKLDVHFKKTKEISSSFYEEIIKTIQNLKVAADEAIIILDKYLIKAVDQKKFDRRQLIQRVCQLANNVILMADMSADFDEITDLYVQGMMLDAVEKKLISQNIGKHYEIECRNYESGIGDIDQFTLGILYNEYHYFHDVDLAATLEKNDKINRNTYDNLFLGTGVSMIIGVATMIGLAVFYQFDINSMQSKIADNEKFFEENSSINETLNHRTQLQNTIKEIENYEDYFRLSNVNLKAVYQTLQAIDSGVTVKDIAIDKNFKLTIVVSANDLTAISKYMEELIANGYTEVSFSNIRAEDNSYKVDISLKFIPEKEDN